jgi:hypothetical protein
MSDEYVIPEQAVESVNVLPTDRLVAIVAMFHVMEDALIEIGAAFERCVTPDCDFCGGDLTCMSCRQSVEAGCIDTCPGLLARRALGVA